MPPGLEVLGEMDDCVMVIDGNAPVRRALAAALEHAGHKALPMPDSKSAVVALSQGAKPGLILLDIDEPHCRGWWFLEWLRDRDASCVPVIATSTQADGAIEQLAHACGADWFLSKPFLYDELTNAIGCMLERHPSPALSYENAV